MNTTAKKTWSEWNAVICGADACETWTCERLLNQRDDLNVLVVGRARYRADRKVKVTLEELQADGWKKTHRFDF